MTGMKKGIKLIEHIYDFRVQRFYTLEQLQNLYNIHQKDFLKYYNIVSNISKEWKNKLKMKTIITYLKIKQSTAYYYSTKRFNK